MHDRKFQKKVVLQTFDSGELNTNQKLLRFAFVKKRKQTFQCRAVACNKKVLGLNRTMDGWKKVETINLFSAF